MRDLTESVLLFLAKLIVASALFLGIATITCIALFSSCTNIDYLCTFEGYHRPTNTLHTKQSPYLNGQDALIWCDSVSNERIYENVKCACQKLDDE